MRRMIPEEKAKLLNKQTIDSNGVVVDENDREFNGDVKFTGTVSGISILSNHKLVGDISFVGDFDPDTIVVLTIQYSNASNESKTHSFALYPSGEIVDAFPDDIAFITGMSLSNASSCAIEASALTIEGGALVVAEYLDNTSTGLLLKDVEGITFYE